MRHRSTNGARTGARVAAFGTLVLTVTGVVAASPASAATADTATPASGARPNAALQPLAAGPALSGLTGAVPAVVRPAKDLRLDPFANSSADPLNNGVAVQPDQGPTVTTLPVTSGLSNGGGLPGLPVVGDAAGGLLPG